MKMNPVVHFEMRKLIVSTFITLDGVMQTPGGPEEDPTGDFTYGGWNNSTLIKGNVVQAIKDLKEQKGPDIQVHGSSNLIQTLLKHDLIDEFRVWIFPVTIGKGKNLFGEGTQPANLKLIDSKTSTTGVIIATYEPAGELKTGSFAQKSE